jgi:peptidoglycan/xylan/chitin deacetylase (PgdA/CDA1 family)
MLKAALSAMYFSGAHRAMAPVTRGVGVMLALHQVRPELPGKFEPNRILKISPEFLDQAIGHVRGQGFDIVSLDEAHWRLVEGRFERRFACFTFDDGYRDNLEHAYPVFRRHGLPLAIYIPTDYADGRGDLWWLALEKVVSEVDSLSLRMAGDRRTFRTETPAGKEAAFHELYWWLRGIDEAEARGLVRDLCQEAGIDVAGLCGELMMGWDEIRRIAGDPLVTIGAHTKSHFALARLSYAQARLEMEDSIRRIERELGQRPQHFSYPYGTPGSAGAREFQIARELGMKTAVTTRKGLLFPEHGAHLMALPRLSLNGDYQHRRYLSVLMSGAPFYFWNGMRRVVAA